MKYPIQSGFIICGAKTGILHCRMAFDRRRKVLIEMWFSICYPFCEGDTVELCVKKFEELSNEELYEILRARVNIFVVEQKCAYPEIDGKDQKAYHVFLKEDQVIHAYLRVLDRGISYDEVSIGRVLTTARGKGLGAKIMDAGIKTAENKLHAAKIRIEAQVYAKGFYEKFGFKQVSDAYPVDGIPHIQMLRE